MHSIILLVARSSFGAEKSHDKETDAGNTWNFCMYVEYACQIWIASSRSGVCIGDMYSKHKSWFAGPWAVYTLSAPYHVNDFTPGDEFAEILKKNKILVLQ
jgi:hypothetical protein